MNARRKILTTGAIRSRKLAQASCIAERMYWRIYMASDNYGTMSADPWDVWQASAPGVTGLNEKKVAQAIDELADLELLLVWFDNGRKYLHVIGHDKHQSADFLRKRGLRKTPTPPEKTLQNEVVCPGGSKGHEPYAPLTSTSTSTSKEEITNVILSEKPAGSHDISEIFDHWVGLTYTGKGPKPKLSPKRKQRIKARIADGWTVEQLKQALTGYSRDPFWRGENDGKPKLELAYRLGSTEEVERGLSLHADPAHTQMSNDDKWAFYAGQGEAS